MATQFSVSVMNSTQLYDNRSGLFNISSENESSSARSTTYFVVVCFICVFGTGGNLLVLLAIMIDKKLRTVANYLIGHLSFVDMLVCCINLPWYLAVNSGISSDDLMCILYANTFSLLPNLSIHTQCLIGISRYVLVVKSTAEFRRKFSQIRTCAALLTIWILNIISVLFVYFFTANGPMKSTELCYFFADPNKELRRVHQYISSAFSVLTFSIAFVCYGKLIYFVRKSSLSLNANKRADAKASMALLALLLVYGVSLILSPLLLNIIQKSNLDSSADILREILNCVLLINYCINPICYGLRIRFFKDSFSKILCPCVSSKVQPIQPADQLVQLQVRPRQ